MSILKYISVTVLLFVLSISSQAQTDFFDQTNSFLSSYVKSGKVDYEQVSQNESTLDELVRAVASYSLTGTNKDKAFYMNAYNILVINSVVVNYPISSPLDVAGFFDAQTHTVAGKTLTLNAIENEVIRPTYKDARIHFALVCAAKGCPKIKGKAFTAANQEIMLEANTKASMNDDNFIRVDEANKTVNISKIFEWYKADFGTTDNDLIAYINQYRDNPIPDGFTVAYYEYDWRLNKL